MKKSELKEKCRQMANVTMFDRITASPEVLAPLLVYTIRIAGGLNFMYSSHLIDDCYYEKEKAIAATVAKLKEVADE